MCLGRAFGTIPPAARNGFERRGKTVDMIAIKALLAQEHRWVFMRETAYLARMILRDSVRLGGTLALA